ncbi:MAG: hydroxymethylglutaryl-CoA reductase, degradative [Cryomorphaceae bacterium]|nr:hydroxymethylglutaryl-CoA reductase, degradative [Cryomorphaceae bacterium]
MKSPIKGFSKLTQQGKIEWLVNEVFDGDQSVINTLKSYLHQDEKVQKLHNEFIENTITNYYLPLGVAPNFLIDGKLHTLPMAIEESSVVAAAAKAAQFWLKRGGFKTTIVGTEKIGHVHFMYRGDGNKLKAFFEENKNHLKDATDDITANMQARGGGITAISLVDKTSDMADYYQLDVRFQTCDSMGANFINSCLERLAETLTQTIESDNRFTQTEKQVQIVMRILSNYTPNCLVRAEVRCPIEDLSEEEGVSPHEFAEKFYRAVRIAEIEPYRATTHNKGIFNGIDAVVIATGNDFRAVEAAGHTHASKSGQYRSLTHCEIENGIFRFWIETPMAVGVVGGLTGLHPMVKLAHRMLGNPSAPELMGIIAASGLAQNFAALRALVTSGIQKGHMKMHLLNILNQLEATEEEKQLFVNYFKDKVVSHNAVVRKFCEMRDIPYSSMVKK